MTDDGDSVIADRIGDAVDTVETAGAAEGVGLDAAGGMTLLMSNSSAGAGAGLRAGAVGSETVGGSAGPSSENIGAEATGLSTAVVATAATGAATAAVTVDAAGAGGAGACVGSWWGSVMCSSPDRAPLKSRRPLPSERPTSGSRFGPRTSSATTRMNSRWVGWRMSPTMTPKLSAPISASTEPLDGWAGGVRTVSTYSWRVPTDPPPPVTDLDWTPERAREFAGRIVDLYTGYLEELPTGPTSPPSSLETVRAAVALEVPDEPLADDALVAHLQAMLDHSLRPGAGGFLAYITSGGTVPGAISDMLASGVNGNVGGWMLSAAATEIELQLIRWLTNRFGLPAGSGGMVVQGGSLANLTAMKLARDHAWPSGRTDGVAVAPPLAFYASEEAHFTIERAADVLGLGEAAVRKVPVDADMRIRVDELERLIDADLAAGVRPAAIVGSAGTTGTGAIDPLPVLADLARRHGAWFHVDAAYGGAIALSDTLRPLLNGIERADSITFDAHKWMYTSLLSAFVLVRDDASMARSFSASAAYVAQERDYVDRGRDLGFEGLQLSRNFSALRVWVSLLAHGRAAYARRIEHDVELTGWLAGRIEQTPELELVCPPSLSICCFRYRPDGVTDEDYIDRLNTRVMTDLQVDGTVFPSPAAVHGRAAIRSCIVNYRTEAVHLERLLELTLEIGRRLHASGALA